MKKNQKEMIAALQRSLGLVRQACLLAGVSRATHYHWMQTNKEYAEAVEYVLDEAGDMVEGELFKRIKAGDTTAIIFYCKTKLKHRGYTERIESQLSGNVEIVCSFQE